jgi:hypothetical protein
MCQLLRVPVRSWNEMSVNRVRVLRGAVLTVIAAVAVASSHAGSVSPPSEATAVEAPIDFDPSSPTQRLDGGSDFANVETSSGPTQDTGATGSAWTTIESPGDHSELLLLGDFQPAQPPDWSPGFADGSMNSGAPATRGGPQGSVFAPAPEQVLIPLPSAAWTGFTGLAALGALGMMKHARRLFR